MNLYVSNLGDQITEESLRAVFATYGDIRSIHLVRSENEEKKAFAFIEMPNEEKARFAMQKINGKVVNGSIIEVVKAEIAESRDSRFIELLKSKAG